MESAIATTIDLFHEKINTKRKVLLARAGICLVFFLCGLTMVTRVNNLVINSISLFEFKLIKKLGRSFCIKFNR